MTKPQKKAEPKEQDAGLTFRRRDMLEAETVAGVPFSKLFHEDNGEQVATALGALAMQYVIEKRSGLTDLEWDDWLDGEPEDIEVTGADPS